MRPGTTETSFARSCPLPVRRATWDRIASVTETGIFPGGLSISSDTRKGLPSDSSQIRDPWASLSQRDMTAPRLSGAS